FLVLFLRVPLPISTTPPYTTLFRSVPSGFSHAVVSSGGRTVWLAGQTALDADGTIVGAGDIVAQYDRALANLLTALDAAGGRPEDRKSTRLNSSHVKISYAVFCLKK